VLLPPLAPANRDSGADACKLFQGNTASSVFSLCNNTLADYVVDVGCKTGFLPRTLHQETLGGFRPFGLKLTSQLGMALSEAVDLVAGIKNPIGIGSDVLDAQVYPEEFRKLSNRRLFHLANLVKVEVPVTENQVGLAGKMFQQFKLSFAGDKWNRGSAVNRPDGDRLRGELPGKDTLVVGDAAVPFEDPHDIPVELIAIGNLGKHSYHELGSQLKSGANIIIEQVVKVILAKGLCFPGPLADVVGRIVYRFKSGQERLMLLCRRIQLDLRYQLHANIIAYGQIFDKGGLAHSSAA